MTCEILDCCGRHNVSSTLWVEEDLPTVGKMSQNPLRERLTRHRSKFRVTRPRASAIRRGGAAVEENGQDGCEGEGRKVGGETKGFDRCHYTTSSAEVSEREHLYYWVLESHVYTDNELSRSEPPTRQHLQHPHTHSAAERDQTDARYRACQKSSLSVGVEIKKKQRQTQSSPLGGWKEFFFVYQEARAGADGWTVLVTRPIGDKMHQWTCRDHVIYCALECMLSSLLN